MCPGWTKIFGAGEGIRTLDPDLGKVVLYPGATPPASERRAAARVVPQAVCMAPARNLEPVCISICGHALRSISKSLLNNHTYWARWHILLTAGSAFREAVSPPLAFFSGSTSTFSPLSKFVEIIRPRLHHQDTLRPIPCTVGVGPAHSARLLVRELPLDGVWVRTTHFV